MSYYQIGQNGNASPNVEFLVGNTGGPVGPNGSFQIGLVGAGSVNVVGNPGANSLTISVSGSGLTWNNITATSGNMTSNNGYFANNAGLVTLTLPATAVFGDYLSIVGLGAGGWKIAANTGQSVRVGANASTVTTGTVSSGNRYDSIDLVLGPDGVTWFSDGGPQSLGVVIT